MRYWFAAALLWLAVAFDVRAVTVEDDLGRSVTLPQPPERIAALAPHAVEMLFYLGAGDRVVATVEHADYPGAARRIPRVGDAFALSLEALVARRPALVVAWASALAPERIARIESLGMPVYVSEPKGLADVLENLRELERLLGIAAGGDAAPSERFARAIKALEPAAGSPRVAFLVGHTPLLAVSNDHFLGALVQRCGARNPFGAMAGSVVRLSVEALLAAELDRLAYPATPPARAWERRLEALGLSDVALKIPADLVARPGPRLLEGAQYLCRMLGRPG